MYSCLPDPLSPDLVLCGKALFTISLGSPTKTMTFGTWGNEPEVLAIVNEDIPSIVKFYTIYENDDRKPGKHWFDIDYNDIEEWGFGNKVIDINLHDNTMYTVIEGKSSRFIGITSYIVDV